MDLAAVRYLSKIATQCRGEFPLLNQCVTSYYVNVKSAYEDDYTAVCGTSSCPQLFTGNDPARDLETVVTNEFDWPIAARFVRLNPQSWNNHIAMRWEIYGCDHLN